MAYLLAAFLTMYLTVGVVYLISYLMDPYIYANHFTPLLIPRVVTLQEAITDAMVFDIFITMVTGFKKDDTKIEEAAPEALAESGTVTSERASRATSPFAHVMVAPFVPLGLQLNSGRPRMDI